MEAKLVDVLTLVERQPVDTQHLKEQLRSDVFGSTIPCGLRAKVYQILLFGYSRKDDHIVTGPVQTSLVCAVAEADALKADVNYAWRELGMTTGKSHTTNDLSLAKLLKLLLFCCRKRGLQYDKEFGLAQVLAPFILLSEEEPLLGESTIPEVCSMIFY